LIGGKHIFTFSEVLPSGESKGRENEERAEEVDEEEEGEAVYWSEEEWKQWEVNEENEEDEEDDDDERDEGCGLVFQYRKASFSAEAEQDLDTEVKAIASQNNTLNMTFAYNNIITQQCATILMNIDSKNNLVLNFELYFSMRRTLFLICLCLGRVLFWLGLSK